MTSLRFFVRERVANGGFRDHEFRPGNAQDPLCYEINLSPDTGELELRRQNASPKESRALVVLCMFDS
jgi:hypothetical protein